MTRILLSVLVLSLAVVAWADDKVSPFYSLPPDGTWVEYDWQSNKSAKEMERGTMRIASVGVKDVDRVRCRALEIQWETKRGDKPFWERRELFVAEKAFADGTALEECARACFHHDSNHPEAVRVKKAAVTDFLRMELRSDDLTLKEIAVREEVATGLGKFKARHVSASGKIGDRQLEYQAWQTAACPFGVAKFELREKRGDEAPRLTFSATVQRSGKDAKSSLDEATAP